MCILGLSTMTRDCSLSTDPHSFFSLYILLVHYNKFQRETSCFNKFTIEYDSIWKCSDLSINLFTNKQTSQILNIESKRTRNDKNIWNEALSAELTSYVYSICCFARIQFGYTQTLNEQNVGTFMSAQYQNSNQTENYAQRHWRGLCMYTYFTT